MACHPSTIAPPLKLAPDDRARPRGGGPAPALALPARQPEPGSLAPLPTIVSWNDLVRGEQTVDVGSLSDPVVIRADGTFLYTFTSVIDDIDFGVTHVLRGEDHVTNTGVQIQLFEAMGHGAPAFAHHNLLVGRDGHALSKRDKSLSVASLREAGLEPMAVACHAALVGTSDAVEPLASLDELAARLDLARISTAPARFDPAELAALNARLLHRLPYASVARRLAVLEVGGGEPFWLAVRGNLSVLADARTWWRIVADEITPVIEDAG